MMGALVWFLNSPNITPMRTEYDGLTVSMSGIGKEISRS